MCRTHYLVGGSLAAGKEHVMKWGVYDRRHCNDKTVHVAPCREDGVIAKGHTVLIRCDCQPRREQYGSFTLVIHRED